MEWSSVHFRDRAREAGRELPRDALELVISRYVQAGTYRRSDLPGCIATAASIARLREPAIAAAQLMSRAQPNLPDSHLLRAYAKKLSRLRRNLFGKVEPPFKSYTDAAAWIKSKIGSARPLEEKETGKIVQRLQQLAADLTLRFEKSVAISLSIPSLAYLSPDGEGTMYAKVPTDGPLELLKAFAEEVTSRTALAESTVVSWVLLGEEPRAATVEVAYKPSAVQPRIEILVRADDLTENHWRSARRLAKTMVHPEGTGPRAERDRVLLGLLKKMGGIPRHNRMQFYRQVHKALPAEHKPTSVEGTRMWITRLKKRAPVLFASLQSR